MAICKASIAATVVRLASPTSLATFLSTGSARDTAPNRASDVTVEAPACEESACEEPACEEPSCEERATGSAVASLLGEAAAATRSAAEANFRPCLCRSSYVSSSAVNAAR